MPFLKDFIINPSTKIKLWKLNLGELDYFELDEYDRNLMKAKKNELVREQFLAIRKTLQLEDPSYKIRYDESGKPSINSDLNISISHSKCMAAIVFSEHNKAGIDIEPKGRIQSQSVQSRSKYHILSGCDQYIQLLKRKI